MLHHCYQKCCSIVAKNAALETAENAALLITVYTIYINVLELDEEGNVLNNTYAQKRATDYLKQYCLNDYTVEPEYENWEIELHGNTYP